MTTNTKEVFQYSLAALIVLGFFATLILLIIQSIPKENIEAMLLALGALIGAFSGVIGYFFGSSISSAKKDATIAQQNTDLLQKKDDAINTIINGQDTNC